MTKAKAVALAESDEEAVETSLPRSFADGSETISGHFLWKIIRTEIRERGNDGGSYTVIYESPFTANSAGPLLLRIFVKIGIELSSIVLGGMILIVFVCIINAVIRQMWPSAGILIVMEACLVMICVAAGVLEFFLEEATTSLGRIIRS